MLDISALFATVALREYGMIFVLLYRHSGARTSSGVVVNARRVGAAGQERRLERLQEILNELEALNDWKKPGQSPRRCVPDLKPVLARSFQPSTCCSERSLLSYLFVVCLRTRSSGEPCTVSWRFPLLRATHGLNWDH
jgi:hypothetical protein